MLNSAESIYQDLSATGKETSSTSHWCTASSIIRN